MIAVKTVEVVAFPGFGSSMPNVSKVTMPAAPWEVMEPPATPLAPPVRVSAATRRKNMSPLTAEEVLGLLREGPKRSIELREATGRTEDSVRHRLQRMAAAGLITATPVPGAQGSARLWSIKE